ncbi:MAG: hypothetical protein ACR2HY_01915 [Acidimicrobiales bacterium]
MLDAAEELNVSELDDPYLKVLLLLASVRAESAEPRRAGFWHGLAGILSAEQEKRQGAGALGRPEPVAVKEGEMAELALVLDELRRDVATVESEYRASYGQMPPAGD